MSAPEAKLAIGLMSGTSMDGIDVSLLRTDGRGLIEPMASREYPFDRVRRARLEDAVRAGISANDRDELRGKLADLEMAVTDWHAEAVERFEGEVGERAAVVGFHGQTVAHRPQSGWTLQLGLGDRLAARLRRTVVFDFRTADMEAGGEGAPLVPVYHEGLLAGRGDMPDGAIAFLNIGGIANATILRPGKPPSAFDCGPGNVLIDRWVQREVGVPYDAGGRIASEGRIATTWLNERLCGEFYARSGPRSLDRHDFELPASGELELSDGARTLVRLTAEAAARSLSEDTPSLVIVCGGGRLNGTMMADLDELIPGRVARAEEFGMDGGALEAQAFAYLAVRTLNGDVLTFPTTTGCRRASTGGVVCLP